MPLRYQPGDRVIVRSDLQVRKRYCMDDDFDNWMYANEDMRQYSGEVVTIAGPHVCDRNVYAVEESPWKWTDEMFDGYADEEILSAPDIDYDSFDWN